MTPLLLFGLFATDSSWVARPTTVTLGDSVRIVGIFETRPGSATRVDELALTSEFELLEPPTVEPGESGVTVRIRFTVAVFATGEHTIVTPRIQLVGPDGEVTTIGPSAVPISVMSVLPAADSLPDLRPGFDPIPRKIQKLEPLVYTLLAVILVAFAWEAVRLRTPVDPVGREEPPPPMDLPLVEWAAAGETTTVAALSRQRLVRALMTLSDEIGESNTTEEILTALQPTTAELPYREIGDLFAALDRVSLAPTHGEDAGHLANQVDDMVEHLLRGRDRTEAEV